MEGGANPTSTGNVAQLVKIPLSYVQPHLTGGANPQEPERNPDGMHPRWQNGHTTNLTLSLSFSLLLFLSFSLSSYYHRLDVRTKPPKPHHLKYDLWRSSRAHQGH